MLHKVLPIGGMTAAVLLLAPAVSLAAPAVPPPSEGAAEERPAREAPLSDETPTPGSATEVRFALTEIRVEHEGMTLPDEKLAAISARYTGRELTGAALGELLGELTRYARAHGYPVAAAYVPEQTAVEGRLLLRVLPGRVGNVTLENGSRLSDDVARGILARLKAGEILRAKDLETALSLLDDLGGVKASGTLSAGATTGETDLLIRLTDDKPFTATLYAENYGSKSAGRYRYGLAAALENVGGTGGRLSLGGLLSNHSQHAYSLGYEMPVGHSATRLGLGFSRTDYELGSIFAELGAEGVVSTWSLWGETPLWKTAKSALSVTYGFDYRDITDKMMGFSWDKHSASFHAGLSGTGRGDGSYLSYRVEARGGTLTADSGLARQLGEDGNTLGGFWKGTLDLTAVQSLGHSTDILLKAQGQKASRNLDSSEEIYLGGARGVRAYPQGEASGDEGALGTLELRWHTPLAGLTLSTYLDAGHVRGRRDGRGGSETLKGWGVGVTYSRPGDWFARFDYARRIGAPEVASADARSRGRMWFLLGKVF